MSSPGPRRGPRPLPWEAGGNPFTALLATAGLVAFWPGRFLAAPPRGDWRRPYLFFLAFSALLALAWGLWTALPWIAAGAVPRLGGQVLLAAWLAACFWVAAPFLFSLLLDLFLGLAEVKKGYSAYTFRVVCYGQASCLALAVPYVGWLVTALWWTTLATLYLSRVHQAAKLRVGLAAGAAAAVTGAGFMMFLRAWGLAWGLR